jgi:hypothetical protein
MRLRLPPLLEVVLVMHSVGEEPLMHLHRFVGVSLSLRTYIPPNPIKYMFFNNRPPKAGQCDTFPLGA